MKQLIMIILLTTAVWWIINSHTEELEKNVVAVDPALKTYVKEWCWEMEKAGLDWEPGFRNLRSIQLQTYSVDKENILAGQLVRSNHTVTINRKYAERGECVTRNAVFHELGHAVFRLSHNCCFIMNTNASRDEQQYCDRWDLYVAEYLVQCKKAADER